jgi:hypothetical protein
MLKLNVKIFEFDSRVVEWNIQQGKVTKEQLAQYLKNLPDDGGNSEAMNINDDNHSADGHATLV